MQVTASFNNLRMTPRKVRLVTNLVMGMDAKTARVQLNFMNKKAAPIVLKLLNSGLSNAKHNFNIDEDNLFINKLIVEAGPSLKRWMPRAMGRATPILKRTCNINLILSEKTPGKAEVAPKRKQKVEKERKEEIAVMPEKEEKITALPPEEQIQVKPTIVNKPYKASSVSKKRFFSRQTFGNVKKMFRRKSI